MADYNSSLPIRTENAGDAIVKVADATIPSQQLKVESDGSINVNAAFSPETEINVAISDGSDTLAINADGSINVRISEANGASSVADYDTQATLAAAASDTHTYTSTGNFYLEQVEASASGKLKIEVQVNGSTRFVQFNSTANPNCSLQLKQPILVTSGQTVTVIRTNRDNQAQDVYSTILGFNA